MFTLLDELKNIEIIAIGNKIRENIRLIEIYGNGRWRKMKGTANIILDDGTVSLAEIHWYEAHGLGRKEFKIKYLINS
jgi:hypothetical protein